MDDINKGLEFQVLTDDIPAKAFAALDASIDTCKEHGLKSGDLSFEYRGAHVKVIFSLEALS